MQLITKSSKCNTFSARISNVGGALTGDWNIGYIAAGTWINLSQGIPAGVSLRTYEPSSGNLRLQGGLFGVITYFGSNSGQVVVDEEFSGDLTFIGVNTGAVTVNASITGIYVDENNSIHNIDFKNTNSGNITVNGQLGGVDSLYFHHANSGAVEVTGDVVGKRLLRIDGHNSGPIEITGNVQASDGPAVRLNTNQASVEIYGDVYGPSIAPGVMFLSGNSGPLTIYGSVHGKGIRYLSYLQGRLYIDEDLTGELWIWGNVKDVYPNDNTVAGIEINGNVTQSGLLLVGNNDPTYPTYQMASDLEPMAKIRLRGEVAGTVRVLGSLLPALSGADTTTITQFSDANADQNISGTIEVLGPGGLGKWATIISNFDPTSRQGGKITGDGKIKVNGPLNGFIGISRGVDPGTDTAVEVGTMTESDGGGQIHFGARSLQTGRPGAAVHRTIRVNGDIVGSAANAAPSIKVWDDSDTGELGDFHGTLEVTGNVDDEAEIEVLGTLAGAMVINAEAEDARNMAGTLRIAQLTGANVTIRADDADGSDGNLLGSIEVTGAVDAASTIIVEGNMAGSLTVNTAQGDGGEMAGSLIVQGGMTGTGNVTIKAGTAGGGHLSGTIDVADAIGPDRTITIEGDLTETGSIIVNSDADLDESLEGTINLGRDLLGTLTVRSDSELEEGGHLAGTFDVARNIGSQLSIPNVVIEGQIAPSGSIRAAADTVANPGADDSALVTFSVAGQTYTLEAKKPREWISPQDPFNEGPAHGEFNFDVTIARGTSGIAPKATITLPVADLPQGESFDLHIPCDLARLNAAGAGDPQLHNLYLDGNVTLGEHEYAVDLPDAVVNSIYVGGDLGSKPDQTPLDRIRVDTIGLLAFRQLGDAGFYVPRDGTTGTGTPILTADTFAAANDNVQELPAFGQLNHSFFYGPEESTGSPPGFLRTFDAAVQHVSFYHRNSQDDCISNSCAGPASWCCAKGPTADIDNNSIVNLTDFTTFAVCFGLTAPNDTCLCDQFAHSDMNLDGIVSLSDFATFAAQVGLSSDPTPDDCCVSPPCEEGLADLEFLQEFLEETIEPLISGDNDWVAAIQALTAEIAAFEPEQEYAGIVAALDAINFKPVAQDSAVSVAKNGSKIMSLGTSSDPDGDTLLRDLVTTDPAHGTLSEGVYDFDGNLISFRYTPDTDYTGEDTLTWRASEVGTTQEYYDEAVITITVTE